MTTDNKQSVLTDDELMALLPGAIRLPAGYRECARAIEQAVLAKLRGAGEPSDEEIETLALSHGFNKSDEHWGSRYYTELGQNLFSFARALLSLYAAPQASAEARKPDGYALVPVKPSEEMMRAMESCSDDWPRTTWLKAWAAALSAAPAAEAPAKGAGDVELPKLPKPQNGRTHYAQKDIIDYARAAVLADRQQRGGDVSSLHEALRWTAACLLAYTDGSEGESFRMTETGETKLISEVLDMADAALAPPEKIN